MKTKLMQILALALALTLCLGMLAGCGDNNNDGTKGGMGVLPSGNNGPFKNSDTYPLSSDKTFTVFSGSAKLDEKYVNQFWTGVTGVKTDWVQWDVAQMNTALATKDITDIFALHSRLTKAKVKEYGEAGMFINYMDYLEYMPNVRAMFEKYPEALAVVQNDDGTVYSLPQAGAKVGGLASMAFRTDMLKAANWDKAPATTDEFLQCIKDIQAHFGKDDPEFCAFNAYRASYMDWDSSTNTLMSWFFPAFGEMTATNLSVNKDGKVVFGATTEQYKHTLEYLNQIWESGAFGTNVYSEDGTVARGLIADNKIACSMTLHTLAPRNFESGKIELTMCEPLTSSYYSEKHSGQFEQFTWYNMMISSKCEDIITACKWMDAFYAEENNPLNDEGTIWGISFSLGEYGVDWTLDKDKGTYHLIENNGHTTGSGTSMVNLAPGHFDFPYVQEGEATGTDVLAQLQLTHVIPYRERMTNYNLSILNLTEEESDTYNDAWVGIDKYIDEMTAAFITGRLDVNEKWDEYVNQLKVLGLDDVINMYQGALNRTLKK